MQRSFISSIKPPQSTRNTQNIIQQNKLAVKFMNSTGGKSVFESDSLAHSMTNFSKNRNGENEI